MSVGVKNVKSGGPCKQWPRRPCSVEHHCRYCRGDSTAHSSPGVPMTHQIPIYAALSLFHSVARGRHTEGFQHFLFVEKKQLPGASLPWMVRGITRGITNVQEGRTSKNKKLTGEDVNVKKCGHSGEISIISQRHTCQGSVH